MRGPFFSSLTAGLAAFDGARGLAGAAASSSSSSSSGGSSSSLSDSSFLAFLAGAEPLESPDLRLAAGDFFLGAGATAASSSSSDSESATARRFCAAGFLAAGDFLAAGLAAGAAAGLGAFASRLAGTSSAGSKSSSSASSGSSSSSSSASDSSSSGSLIGSSSSSTSSSQSSSSVCDMVAARLPVGERGFRGRSGAQSVPSAAYELVRTVLGPRRPCGIRGCGAVAAPDFAAA
mmetsp:Transcript_14362/g.42885  ORF Transcript_14362/g.42885 Transcript_14362/m.42885 type:complete len:234 (-) Transcript_14362:93-794(-)